MGIISHTPIIPVLEHSTGREEDGMIRVCYGNHHRGFGIPRIRWPRVFGIKRPLLDVSRTHGLCKRCLELELKAIIERRGVKRNGKDHIEV